MFRCERCGSSYNPMHAAVTENCPRCLLRDRVNSPLTFKLFRLPLSDEDAPPGEAGEESRGGLTGAGASGGARQQSY